MAQNTSVYWKSEEVAEQARALAQAKGISVSQLVSDLVSEAYTYFEPPIEATCPTCHQPTLFVFLTRWEGLSGDGETFKLYRCESCKTTLGESSLKEDSLVSTAIPV